VVATDPTADVIAAWTWQAEFVAACTRLGRMPTMFQSYAIPGSKERAAALKGKKFHEQKPQAVPAGKLGGQYLRKLGRLMAGLHETEMDDIRTAAAGAAKARQAGKGVYLYAQNHAQLFRLPCAHDGGYFRQINRGWVGLHPGVQPGEGDFVLCMAYDNPFTSEDWKKFDALVRNTGATLAWSMATYQEQEVAKVPPEQVVIDQKWPLGDAIVEVPGYDIAMIPPSGAISEAVLWMVTAELAGLADRR